MWYTEYHGKNQLGTQGGRKASATVRRPLHSHHGPHVRRTFRSNSLLMTTDRGRAHASTHPLEPVIAGLVASIALAAEHITDCLNLVHGSWRVLGRRRRHARCLLGLWTALVGSWN